MPKGDCYSVHIDFLREAIDRHELPDWRLCHGTVTNGHGQAIGHCWLESRGVAYDFSNGNRFSMPAAEYRELTKARDVTEYTSEQISVNVIKSGHLGPWK